MARVCGYRGNPEDLLKDNKSGLVTYIFGKDRSRVLHVNEFKRLQRELIRDVLFLEFIRYQPDEKYHTIDEIDFCKHLLYNAHIPSKKKQRMLKRVEKAFKDTQGITFDEFKNFYYVLFGGADLERAMFFLDTEKNGVTKDEFYNTSNFGILPMGFCYPGKGKSGDLPPRKECAPLWHEPLLELLPNVQLTLLVGNYSQRNYLSKQRKKTLTETVAAWTEYRPKHLPLPHPSPRNNIWIKKNPWFEKTVLPYLKRRVKRMLKDHVRN